MSDSGLGFGLGRERSGGTVAGPHVRSGHSSLLPHFLVQFVAIKG